MFSEFSILWIPLPGLDGLPARFLRLAAPAVSEPLTRLFNLSLDSSVVPSQWKSSYITPKPKLNQPRTPQDYRPISITPILSRIMEKSLGRSGILYSTLYLNIPTTVRTFQTSLGSGPLAHPPVPRINQHASTAWVCPHHLTRFLEGFRHCQTPQPHLQVQKIPNTKLFPQLVN